MLLLDLLCSFTIWETNTGNNFPSSSPRFSTRSYPSVTTRPPLFSCSVQPSCGAAYHLELVQCSVWQYVQILVLRVFNTLLSCAGQGVCVHVTQLSDASSDTRVTFLVQPGTFAEAGTLKWTKRVDSRLWVSIQNDSSLVRGKEDACWCLDSKHLYYGSFGAFWIILTQF